MAYLEHEPDLEDKCGCPSCDLSNEYLEKIEKNKHRKPFKVIVAGETASETELAINQMYERGYEMTAIINGQMVLRLMPPMPPTNADVINEYARRKEEMFGRVAKGEINWDDFNPVGEA